MKEWVAGGDDIVSDWEMKETFKLLDIPAYQHDLLQNSLKQGVDGKLSVSTLMDDIQELYFDTKETNQSSVQHIKVSMQKINQRQS